MPFFNFTSAAPKNFFFLQIHSLNLGKEENLSFDVILFVYDLSVIKKISLFDLTCVLKVGGGRWECLF